MSREAGGSPVQAPKSQQFSCLALLGADRRDACPTWSVVQKKGGHLGRL